MRRLSQRQLNYTERFVQEMRDEIKPYVKQVSTGPFVRGVQDGSLPLEGIRFFLEQTYHLVMNDMGNLSIYVAKARNVAEIDFFLFMTIAEKIMLDSHYLLLKAAGVSRNRLAISEPFLGCAFRTNYFSKLAITALPGEIALGILLNFPVWAGGARRISAGLKKHYGFGKKASDSEKLDTDVLDRFSRATKGFQLKAMNIVASDLTRERETRMRSIGLLGVEYEALVWENYYLEGLRRAERGKD